MYYHYTVRSKGVLDSIDVIIVARLHASVQFGGIACTLHPVHHLELMFSLMGKS